MREEKRGEREILVLSLKAPPDDDLVDTHFPPLAEEHFFLASQLLQSHPIQLTRLPGLHGVQAIALSWVESAKSTDHRNLAMELNG